MARTKGPEIRRALAPLTNQLEEETDVRQDTKHVGWDGTRGWLHVGRAAHRHPDRRHSVGGGPPALSRVHTRCATRGGEGAGRIGTDGAIGLRAGQGRRPELRTERCRAAGRHGYVHVQYVRWPMERPYRAVDRDD